VARQVIRVNQICDGQLSDLLFDSIAVAVVEINNRALIDAGKTVLEIEVVNVALRCNGVAVLVIAVALQPIRGVVCVVLRRYARQAGVAC
jgi:hypothetical protein